MKKLLTVLLITLLFFVLAACGSDSEEEGNTENSADTNEEAVEEDGETTIVIGAVPVPHIEILEEAIPLLEEEGINLQIESYQEYVLPNQDLERGTLDLNYFQHEPYLDKEMDDKDYDFVSLGGVHVEPMGIYSKGINSVDDIEEGTTVIMSRSVADHGRVLQLLETEDLIKIDEGVVADEATIEDIAENPLNLEFDTRIEPALLTQNYDREEEALVAINTNYAMQFGLVPTEDALILESEDSPYANLIVARAEDQDVEAYQTLVDVLHSDEIQTFMEEEFGGAVIPVSE